MKICFVHEEYPRETNFGGIATYQKIMAEYYGVDESEIIFRGNTSLIVNDIKNGGIYEQNKK